MRIYLILISFFVFTSCSKYDYQWLSIGDSITWQNGRPYKYGAIAKGYQHQFILHQKKSIKLENKGFSGLPLTGSETSVYSELENFNFKNHNLITIFVGTNDFRLNKPIKSADSLNSFKYCLSILIRKIKNQNPNAKIYLLTPLQRDKDGYDISYTNSVGLTLNDYRNEILHIGKTTNTPVIDLYNESGITTQNLSKFTLDGLHPNDAGYKMIAKTLLKYIAL